MSTAANISPDLAEWARLAGFELTQGSEARDGRTLFWNRLGEVRYFIAARSDGWIVVTDSHRMADEHFLFAGESMSVVELFFCGKCGLSTRSARDLPPLRYPRTVQDVVSGYRIETRLFDGDEDLALIDSEDSVLAVTGSGKIAGIAELAALSLYLTTSTEAIKASYLHPAGMPLFRPREE